MLNKLKCLFGYHDWVEIFDPFFTFPDSGMKLGYEEKYCFQCGKKHIG